MISMSNQPNYKPKKRFGQNFMMDENVIGIIISSAELKEEDIVLEIGAGRGELTEHISKICRVIAVELDKELVKILQDKFAGNKNVKIVQGDILDIDFADYDVNKMKAIGNIPYYITTPIIFKLLDNKKYFDVIVLTVQKEIGERIAANEGNKQYSMLSIMVQYHSDVELIRVISKNCFFPKPNVDSAILKLKILEKSKHYVRNEKLFIDLVKSSFQQRRKIFKSAILRLGYSKETAEKVLLELKLGPKVRGEDLSIEQFIAVSNLI